MYFNYNFFKFGTIHQQIHLDFLLLFRVQSGQFFKLFLGLKLSPLRGSEPHSPPPSRPL